MSNKIKDAGDWNISELTVKELHIIKDILDECIDDNMWLYEWQKAIEHELDNRE